MLGAAARVVELAGPGEGRVAEAPESEGIGAAAESSGVGGAGEERLP
jgi:hypothetical protein